MTELAFGIETPRDLLAKARREVERLEQAENWHGTDDWEPIADAAINAALTLWHITDWIANSPDPACQSAIAQIKAKRGSAKTASLAVLQEHVLDDSNIALCDALANGAKHFTIRERSLDPTRLFAKPDATTAYLGSSTVTIRADVTQSGSYSIAMPKPPRYFAKVIINETTSGRALDVFKAALSYWEKFFDDYRL